MLTGHNLCHISNKQVSFLHRHYPLDLYESINNITCMSINKQNWQARTSEHLFNGYLFNGCTEYILSVSVNEWSRCLSWCGLNTAMAFILVVLVYLSPCCITRM